MNIRSGRKFVVLSDDSFQKQNYENSAEAYRSFNKYYYHTIILQMG
jgi:hypothetical protein